MLRWQPALVGTVAAALLIGVLVAPQFLIPRAPENTTPERVSQSTPLPPPATAPAPAPAPARAPAKTARPSAPPAALQREGAPSASYANAAPAVNVAPSANEPRADMSRARSEAALASSARAVQALPPPAAEAASLRRAAAAGDLTGLGAQLTGSVDIDARDEQGRTALMLAIINGRKDAVEWLLARGADPNAADAHGTTPLQAAERHGSPEISEALRRHGAR